jgi:hypothetical protein
MVALVIFCISKTLTMGGLPKIVDEVRTTITNMSYPTCDIQRSKEVVHVIQEAKVRKTFFSLVFATIS